MATPTAEKLAVYYVAGSSAGSVLPTYTIGSNSTTQVITTTVALTAYEGAVCWFKGTTTTAALRRQFFRIRAASGSGYGLSKPLPAAPVSGDQFVICQIGSNRSATQTFGLEVGGTQPELTNVAGANITGLSILYASPSLGEGTLSVHYSEEGSSASSSMGDGGLSIRMGTDPYGEALDLLTETSPAYVFDANGVGYIKVSWTVASLPLEDATDTWTLTAPTGTFMPDFDGYETHATTGGKVRYRAEAPTNTDDLETMLSVSVYSDRPDGTATTIAAGQSLGLTAGDVTLTDASDWPSGSFWVKNTTKNDCRYVTSRSGNTLSCRTCDWVILTGNGTTAATIGATLTGSSSGATAVVVASRAGQAICKSLDGTFTTSDTAGAVGAVSSVVRGFRGYTAVAWAAGDSVEPMSDVDLAWDTDTIETVTTETQIPNLSFATYTSASPLSLGNLAANTSTTVWRREYVLDGATARAEINADTIYSWS